MAKDIAALSGGDKTAFKAALAGMGYMVPISSVTISSPVEYVDIALPTGYGFFELHLIDIVVSKDEPFALHVLAASFSQDGGTTFLADAPNSDTYGAMDQFAGSSSNDWQYYQDSASLMGLAPEWNTGARSIVAVKIWPGGSASWPQLWAESFNQVNGIPEEYIYFRYLYFLNQLAVAPPVQSRITTLRLQSYGNGDANPPSAADTIEGTLTLFGIPTP